MEARGGFTYLMVIGPMVEAPRFVLTNLKVAWRLLKLDGKEKKGWGVAGRRTSHCS